MKRRAAVPPAAACAAATAAIGALAALGALTALGALAALAACGEESSKPGPLVRADATPAVDTPTLAYQRGTLLVPDDSTMVFIACGTLTERRVTLSPRSQLRTAVASVNGAVRDSLFVEFMTDTTRGGVHVRETLFATSLVEGTRCDRPRLPFEWVAVGTEPFWRVTYDGTQMVLERPEPPRELVFDAMPAESRGNLTTIIGRRLLGKVHELKLGVLRESCRDGMSDAWYPYRAEVRVGDVAYAGCARR